DPFHCYWESTHERNCKAQTVYTMVWPGSSFAGDGRGYHQLYDERLRGHRCLGGCCSPHISLGSHDLSTVCVLRNAKMRLDGYGRSLAILQIAGCVVVAPTNRSPFLSGFILSGVAQWRLLP